jgi:hypothetical protein
VSLALLSLGSHPASVNGPVKADFSASCCNLGKQSQHVIVSTAEIPE